MEVLFGQFDDSDPDVFQLATELSETIPSVLGSEKSRVTDRVSTTLNSQTVPEHSTNTGEQLLHDTADKRLLHNTACEQLIFRNVCQRPNNPRNKTHVSDIGAVSARHNTSGNGLARPPIGCGPLGVCV